jgi:hypothetical protein
MVTVVVETPLYIYDIAGTVCDHWLRSPAWAGLVVVYANASVISTWTASTHLGSIKIRPGSDWLQNCALGASVYSSLSIDQYNWIFSQWT